jgi:hypothetical protein
MVNINEEFPSKYLKSADLKGKMARLQIAHVDSEEIGKDRKLVAYFRGKERGMVLNKTNAKTIAEAFGDETDNWTGADIEVFSMKVDYQGRMVDGLRVRIPEQQPKPAAAPKPQGEVRFVANAAEDARVRQAPPPARPTLADDLNDEIPF